MSEPNKNQVATIVTFADLVADKDAAFKHDKFQELMHNKPHASWIKKHPMINVKNEFGQSVPLEYLPVDKVKSLLTRIFNDQWRPEVIAAVSVFQSIMVTVRLHYKHPFTNEWMCRDGIGACGIQTDKGANASDLGAIKLDSVMKAAPAAFSYALKNAAENIGNVFGASLNKWDLAGFKSNFTDPPPPAPTGNVGSTFAGHEGPVKQDDIKQAHAQQPAATEDLPDDFQL